ncbi:MAG: ribonuclease R, partial [Dissulfurispiraceae bacterium]
MIKKQQNVNWLRRLLIFILKVIRNFRRNQGMLLSGAVAYYTLLSIVPMLILMLIILSHLIEEKQLFET